MKTYKVIAVDKVKQTENYVQNRNNYYVFDKEDNSIELWSGNDLKKISAGHYDVGIVQLQPFYFFNNMCVVLENELIIADINHKQYVWYNGYGIISRGASCLEYLSPLKLSDAYIIAGYNCNYGDFMKLVTMEVV